MTDDVQNVDNNWIKAWRIIREAARYVAPRIPVLLILGLTIVVVLVVLIPRDPDTIVIGSQGDNVDFSATTALDYADRISRVAEITIGAILTLALGLAGFSWLSNQSRIERDRQELAQHKTDLETQLSERLRAQTQELEGKFIGLDSTIDRLRIETKQQLEAYYNRSLERQSLSQTSATTSQPSAPLTRSTPRAIAQRLDDGDYRTAFELIDSYLKDIAVTADLRRHSLMDFRTPSGIRPISLMSPREWFSRNPVLKRIPQKFISEISESISLAPEQDVRIFGESIVSSLQSIVAYLRVESHFDQLPLPGIEVDSPSKLLASLIGSLEEIIRVLSDPNVERQLSSDPENGRRR